MNDDMQAMRDEEERALTSAVQVALRALSDICGSEYSTDDRLDAAARILGYAATFQPDIEIAAVPVGGDDDEPEGD